MMEYAFGGRIESAFGLCRVQQGRYGLEVIIYSVGYALETKVISEEESSEENECSEGDIRTWR